MTFRMKYALPLTLAPAVGVANAGMMASAAEALPYLSVEAEMHDYTVEGLEHDAGFLVRTLPWFLVCHV